MVAAGYALYGSATMMVLSLGNGSGVNEFMLDPVNTTVAAPKTPDTAGNIILKIDTIHSVGGPVS